MYNWTPADYVAKMKAELRAAGDDSSLDEETLRLRFALDRSPNFRLHKSKVKFYKKSLTKYDFKHLKIVKKCRISAKFDES